MKDLRLINAFVRAAAETLEAELQVPVERGPLALSGPDDPDAPVTGVVGLTGAMEGVVALGVEKETACAIASALLGETFSDVTPLVASGISEICNIIAGRAAAILYELGQRVEISPPIVITGNNVRLRTVDLPRLLVPFTTEFGRIELKVMAQQRNGGAASTNR